jgi:antitoxin component YwqK of YwqJK toxin-antitoxin module
MKTPPTFLLSLTFLFLFSGSVYGEEEVKKEYWDNGRLIQETYYKNGDKERIESTYYCCDNNYKEGPLKWKIHYKNGKREGLQTQWFETGEKQHETHYKNGKKEGLATGWYKTGEKRSEALWKDGEIQRDGVVIIWYKSGKRKEEIHWEPHGDDWEEDDFERAVIMKWDEDGKKTSQEDFIDYYE